MKNSDAPLAGLDEIPWRRLKHAYGSAKDVPKLLRALRSTSAARRERALHELYGNIFHQGSRYQASAYAVPFLARLAVDPATSARPEIVYLLAALAIGYDEEHLPGGFDVTARRADLERVQATDREQMWREFDQWVEAAPDEEERRVRSMQRMTYDPVCVLRSLQEELDTYDGVRAEIPLLRALVRDEDPQVRAAVAYLLAWFPEEAAGSVAALGEVLGTETVGGVAATAIIAAGLLSGRELVPMLRERLSRSDPLLRWAAAVALARLDVVERDVVAALSTACADPPEDGVRFFDGDSRAYAARTLALLVDRLPEEAVEIMRAWILPTTRAECRAYSGLGPEG